MFKTRAKTVAFTAEPPGLAAQAPGSTIQARKQLADSAGPSDPPHPTNAPLGISH